jgi:uncharacterized phiE125 gp8 family phage protein
MSYITQVTGDEIVTLEVAKQHLRVDFDEDDSYIYMIIQAAREWAETYISQAVVQQTVFAYYRTMTPTMPLPLSNVNSITAIRYLDRDMQQQTITSGFYVVPGVEAVLVFTDPIPEHSTMAGSVVIEYEAGYINANDVPQKIKQAILLQLGDMYENREAQVVKERMEQNLTVTRLLQPLRKLGV